MERNQICWSADVSAVELQDVLSSEVLPKGTMIKLDQVFFEKFGHGYISRCQDAGYPVFADRKISEIPDKTIQVAEVYLAYHPFMLNVMAGVCSTGIMEGPDPKKVDTLARFAELCKETGTRSCAVTVLTSKSFDLVSKEFRCDDPKDQVLWYAKLMSQAGMTDIVCSPMEAKMLRQKMDEGELTNMFINTPGIRLPNTDVRDQSRIMTPANALEDGADRLVIGSNLTDGEGDIVERIEKNYARLEKHLAEAGYSFID